MSVRDPDGENPFTMGESVAVAPAANAGPAELALLDGAEGCRFVVDSMAEGLVLIGKDGALTTCNRAAKSIPGLPAGQIVGSAAPDPRWTRVREDGSPFPDEELPALLVLRSGEPQLNAMMGVRDLDGSATWLRVHAQPLRRRGSRRARWW